MAHDTFWRLTLRQVYAHLDSHSRQLERVAEAQLELAWLNSLIDISSMTKQGRRLPPLREFQYKLFPNKYSVVDEVDDLTRRFREQQKLDTEARVWFAEKREEKAVKQLLEGSNGDKN